ncbi:MAG: integrase [Deltaproteobacteria bacterium]|nr:integrase [Deltaproteobacteria bacterium]|tara:strand:- start:67 stop:771 length:705 start_codon:yes stop_codon:yes gene_type:complete
MNKLTESSIKKAKILDKQYKIYDGEGMFLLVHPNGSKYWRMKYTFDGKSKLASFGVWPTISLKEARVRRHVAKQKIKVGINPIEEKKKNKQLKQLGLNSQENKNHSTFKKPENATFVLSSILSHHKRLIDTKELLQSLKLFIFGDAANVKTFSSLNKQEMKEILIKIILNRGKFFKIIWGFYLSLPVFNIAVLFLLLLIVTDFFPALFTTVVYFILTALLAIIFSLWEENDVHD